jgi:hypothetical protein
MAHESWAGRAVPCPQCKQMAPVPAVSVPPALPPGLANSALETRVPRAANPIPARPESKRRPRRRQPPRFVPPLIITLAVGGTVAAIVAILSSLSGERGPSAKVTYEAEKATTSPLPAAQAQPPEVPEPPNTPLAAGPKQSATEPPSPTRQSRPDIPAAPVIAPEPRTKPTTGSPPSPPRPYEEGPLGPADFGGEPPINRQGLVAFTYSSIRYSYLYLPMPTAKGVNIAATSAEVYAEVDPAQSWNMASDDSRLLAHEQGHFDITQIYALRWRRAVNELIDTKRLTASGANEELARASLDARIERDFRAVKDAMLKEQQQYDDETNNGRDYSRQDEWQRRIRDNLRRSR